MNKINYSKDINNLLDISVIVSSIGLMLVFIPISHNGLRFSSTSFKSFFSWFYFIQGLSFLLLFFIWYRFSLIKFFKLKMQSSFKKKTKETIVNQGIQWQSI